MRPPGCDSGAQQLGGAQPGFHLRRLALLGGRQEAVQRKAAQALELHAAALLAPRRWQHPRQAARQARPCDTCRLQLQAPCYAHPPLQALDNNQLCAA